ncbi:MAG: DNA internalization-related competence protein ComEC/Rec2 [Nitrospirales bacterium]|nr:DNA internalization-related competence protein ComEC/Rec2 [Nitrospirales bacterium]
MMIHLLASLLGAGLFFLQRFFPVTSLLLSGIFLAVAGCLRPGAAGRGRAAPRALLSLLLLVLFFAAGFLRAKVMYFPPPSMENLAGESILVHGTARASAASLPSTPGIVSQVMEVSAAEDGKGIPLRISELRVAGITALDPNRLYSVQVRIPGDAFSLNPGSGGHLPGGYATQVRDLGPVGPGLFRTARLKLNHFLRDRFSAEAAPFLMSLVTGDRSLLPREMSNSFNATGLAHVLSISGAHFGLLLLVLYKTLMVLVKLLPYRMLAKITLCCSPSQIAAVVSIPCIAGYLGLSDMSFPAVRSFLMIALFLCGLVVQRRGFWLNTLLVAAASIVFVRPDSLLDLSFQLSFIAVLCIGMVAAQDAGEEKRVRPAGDDSPSSPAGALSSLVPRCRALGAALFSYTRTSVLVSAAATLGTAPLVAYYFHYFSLVSPFTNLVITPMIGFLILPAALLSSFVYLVSGYFPFLSAIDGITRLVLAFVQQCAQWRFAEVRVPAFPGALLVVFYGALFLSVAFAFRRRNPERSGAGAGFLALPLALVAVMVLVVVSLTKPPGQRGIRVTYLDVGQGDAAVVELPDGKTLVVDTGRNGLQVGDYLRYRGIRRIDALVLSHGQADHAGGARSVAGNFILGEIWDNGRMTYRGFPVDIRRRSVQRGDVAEGEGYSLTVLHAYEGFYTAGTERAGMNNDSLVLKIQGRRNAFLFTGDIEQEGGEDLLHLGDHLRSAVLKVPHHGSRFSAGADFFRAVAPHIAVISVGRGNRYGHPHRETLGMLGAVQVFRTDRDGAVGIREREDGRLEVQTWKDYLMREAGESGEEWRNIGRLFRIW